MKTANLKKQYGFTLTEIMVAVAIGLIGTLVVFKALQSTNIVARNATGGADATTAANIALYGVERDIRMAGYGINDNNLIGCRVLMDSDTLTLPTDIAATATNVNTTSFFTPALIMGTTEAPRLRIAFAGGRSLAATKLTQEHSGTAGEVMRVANLYGLKEASTLIMLGDQDFASSLVPKAGRPCSVLQTSKNFTDPLDREVLTVNSGISPFSHDSGQDYSLEGRVYNLGSLSFANSTLPANVPVWKEYRVDPVNETLEEKNIFTSSNFTTIESNVTSMYLDYIMRDGSIQTGLTNGALAPDIIPTPATTTAGRDVQVAQLRNVVGMRVSLLMRSATPDYSKGVSCRDGTNLSDDKFVTNLNSPSLQTGFKDADGDDIKFTLSRTYNANAFCYRYKAQSTTIMMRNVIWSPS